MNFLKQRYFFLTLQTLFVSVSCFCQQTALPLSKYGLPVLKDVRIFQAIVKQDSMKQMVELKTIPLLKYDLKYAGRDNFMRRRMYPASTQHTFLRLPAAEALGLVQKELNEKGLGLKIFDAYRPYSVTEKFWELVHDDRYVADPKKGSGHNRGLAVDLTIIDLKTGAELAMPTAFDNFTDTAHHDFTGLPQNVVVNRNLLKEIMTKHGFREFSTEWWHYFWPNNREYEVLDLDFRTLNKIKNDKP